MGRNGGNGDVVRGVVDGDDGGDGVVVGSGRWWRPLVDG
ncbi:hypothetical protein Tco_0057057, partial [Tanacetum coccineum]